MNIKDEVNKAISIAEHLERVVANVEAATQAEYDKVFDDEKQKDSDIVVKMNMLANIGQLCRKMRTQELQQIAICCGVLKDKEIE